MKNQTDVIVVGSGLGGLAAACTLAGRGYSVTVVEKNEWLGGKAALLEDRGYRFDMGPTILTIPSVLKRVFEEAGRTLSDYLDMVRLDPQWRCFFEDRTQFDLVESLPEMMNRLNDFTGSDRTSRGYEKFMEISKQLDEVSKQRQALSVRESTLQSEVEFLTRELRMFREQDASSNRTDWSAKYQQLVDEVQRLQDHFNTERNNLQSTIEVGCSCFGCGVSGQLLCY